MYDEDAKIYLCAQLHIINMIRSDSNRAKKCISKLKAL